MDYSGRQKGTFTAFWVKILKSVLASVKPTHGKVGDSGWVVLPDVAPCVVCRGQWGGSSSRAARFRNSAGPPLGAARMSQADSSRVDLAKSASTLTPTQALRMPRVAASPCPPRRQCCHTC